MSTAISYERYLSLIDHPFREEDAATGAITAAGRDLDREKKLVFAAMLRNINQLPTSSKDLSVGLQAPNLSLGPHLKEALLLPLALHTSTTTNPTNAQPTLTP